jgi:putative phosphoribosyl transferase
VVGIPPGGMPVAAEVARALGAPLEVVGLRTIAAPEDNEGVIGAVAEIDVTVIDDEAVQRLRIGADELGVAVWRARWELNAWPARCYSNHPRLAVAARTVLLTDDGLAAGSTVRAATRSLRERGAARVILAVPVAPAPAPRALHELVDDVVCAEMREGPETLGLCYGDLSPSSEDEVAGLLSEHQGAASREVAFEAGPGVLLSGELTVAWRAYAEAWLHSRMANARAGLTRAAGWWPTR